MACNRAHTTVRRRAAQVRDIAARFNVAFENMPGLPQPLPPQFTYVSKKANMRDAEALAPLTHVTHPAPSEGRRLLSTPIGLRLEPKNASKTTASDR